MSTKKMAWVLGAATAAAAACSEGSTISGRGEPAPPEVGNLGVALEVAPGVVIDAVSYQITGDGIAPAITGTLPVGPGSGNTFVASIGGVPGGTGRTLALTAAAANGAVCAGSATFDVAAGQTSLVAVVLQCQTSAGTVIVNGSFDVCPLLRSVSAAPGSAPVGSSVAVAVDAVDTEGPITIAWSASAGSFDDPVASATRYACTAGGTQVLTATVTDAAGCSNTLAVAVVCVGAPPDAGACGDGAVDGGEQCDGVDLNGQTCASVTMGARPDGTLACTSACVFDVSGCTGGGGADSGTGGADSGTGGAGTGGAG